MTRKGERVTGAVQQRIDTIMAPLVAQRAVAERESRATLGDRFSDWFFAGLVDDYLGGAFATNWLRHFCPPDVLAAAAAHLTPTRGEEEEADHA
jgi:hypothetical protein